MTESHHATYLGEQPCIHCGLARKDWASCKLCSCTCGNSDNLKPHAVSCPWAMFGPYPFAATKLTATGDQA